MASTSTRAARTQQAILDATVFLISNEGAAAVTPQRVAVSAGVSRATVYRHWPDGAELIQNALELLDFPVSGPSEAPINERITTELQLLVQELKAPETRRLLSILLERAERLQRGEDLRMKLISTFVGHVEEVILVALERGELTDAPDAGELFDRLVGPLWSRRMLRGRPITDAFLEQVVDDALRPWLR